MTKKVIGYISSESLNRLEHGGNDSRGTVPIHKEKTVISNIPVYIQKQKPLKDRLREA